jgi:glutathionylspermidine synthase
MIPSAVPSGADVGQDGGDGYAAYARALVGTGLVTDPWVDGAPRFRQHPLVLPATEHERLIAAAKGVTRALHAVVMRVHEDPKLLDTFFALTPVQQLLWHASAPLWHGVARADVFFATTDDGRGAARAMVCEVNADTPSGHAEAIALSALAELPAAQDPNAHLEARWCAVIERFLAGVERVAPSTAPVVGIVYPTEIGGDHALIRLYQTWCERRGWQVVLGSPFNLQRHDHNTVAMFGVPCDVIVRHYKTDWWAERLPIWSDEAPYPDPDPLLGPIAALVEASLARRCAIVNPFAAVVPQNKRAFAFLWEHINELAPDVQQIVSEHVPETIRLEVADHAQLLRERERWVLKSDYGCEGEEVLIGAALSDDEWQKSLRLALPKRWIAQRYFEACLNEDGEQTNHGVYLAGGRAAGLYTRLSRGATDIAARSVAVKVVP